MIMRIWRTQVDEARAAEYERFAAQQSLPMFRAHRGSKGTCSDAVAASALSSRSGRTTRPPTR
jgi:hypothetical protein